MIHIHDTVYVYVSNICVYMIYTHTYIDTIYIFQTYHCDIVTFYNLLSAF